MNKAEVTPATYVRNVSYALRRRLSDFLDPQDRWRDVAMSIRKPNGDIRYSQQHIRRFQAVVAQGLSPTEELLNDWGTTNCTVGDLVDILRSHQLLAAASLLLPEKEASSEGFPLPAPPPPPAALVGIEPSTRLLADEESSQFSLSQQPRTLQDSNQPPHKVPSASGFSSFLYNELLEITGNFDDRPMSHGGSRIGEGGFGTVYKGLLNDRPVAVKKLNQMDNVSLDELQVQFYQEIQTLKVLKHENLVNMVGFSCDGQHPCLVYAFMANGSLLDRLECLDNSPPLSWRQRCLIAEGAARGLEYLHSNHHVHRDVKSANILLDENLVAKISDFGLTKASPKQTSSTMMTERIVGTRAYMASEALRGEISPKSDIFSFGVVLLEILTGRPPFAEDQEPKFLMEIRDYIDDKDEELTLEDAMDQRMKDWELSQAESIYALACSCLLESRNRRPLIKQVLLEIEGVVQCLSMDLRS